MKDRIKQPREQIEYITLLITAGVSLVISVMDLAGLLDANSWIAQRVPALTLLCVGFIASYLVLERRGKLDDMASVLEQRSAAILRALDVEVEQYHTGGDWLLALATRPRNAKHVDDVSWVERKEVQDRWSLADRTAFEYCEAIITDIVRKRDVVWREVIIFFESTRFKQEKKHIQDPLAMGYSLAYFDPPPPGVPPRIGGFTIVDGVADNTELFIASADSTMWLRIRHPAIVGYFSRYFESLWGCAKKLKVGPDLNEQVLGELEARLP